MNKAFSLLLLTIFITSFLSCNNAPKKESTQPDKTISDVKTADQKEIDPKLAQRLEAGEKVYTQNCAVCHQAGGGGVPNMYPPLNGTDYVLGDKKWLVNFLIKGSADGEPLLVDGTTWSGVMPPFSNLDDSQIADVLTYVRHNYGDGASAVTAQEVKEVRGNVE